MGMDEIRMMNRMGMRTPGFSTFTPKKKLEKIQKAKNRKVLIVCGSNRSGTSLMTRCLKEAGLQMSNDLLAANKANVHGFFESHRFKDLSKRCISGSRCVNEFRNLLNNEGYWVWKYPRCVQVLDVIWEAIPDAVIIFMDRNKPDTMKSLARHAWILGMTPKSKQLYSNHYDSAYDWFKRHKGKGKTITARFENLIKNPVGVVNRVLKLADIPIQVDKVDALDKKEIHFFEK